MTIESLITRIRSVRCLHRMQRMVLGSQDNSSDFTRRRSFACLLKQVVRLILDACEKQRILHSCHSDPTSGHLGTKRTIKRIRERFTWKGLNKEVFQLVMVAISHTHLLTCFYRQHPVRLARRILINLLLLLLNFILFLYTPLGITQQLTLLGRFHQFHYQETGQLIYYYYFSWYARNTCFNRIDYTLFFNCMQVHSYTE